MSALRAAASSRVDPAGARRSATAARSASGSSRGTAPPRVRGRPPRTPGLVRYRGNHLATRRLLCRRWTQQLQLRAPPCARTKLDATLRRGGAWCTASESRHHGLRAAPCHGRHRGWVLLFRRPLGDLWWWPSRWRGWRRIGRSGGRPRGEERVASLRSAV